MPSKYDPPEYVKNENVESIKSYFDKHKISAVLDDAVNSLAVEQSLNPFGRLAKHLSTVESGPIISRFGICSIWNTNGGISNSLVLYGMFRDGPEEELERALILDTSDIAILNAINSKLQGSLVGSISDLDSILKQLPVIPSKDKNTIEGTQMYIKMTASVLYLRAISRIQSPYDAFRGVFSWTVPAARRFLITVTKTPEVVISTQKLSTKTFTQFMAVFHTFENNANSKLPQFVSTPADPKKKDAKKKDKNELSLTSSPHGSYLLPDGISVDPPTLLGWVSEAIAKHNVAELFQPELIDTSTALKLTTFTTSSDLAQALTNDSILDISECTYFDYQLASQMALKTPAATIKIGLPSKLLNGNLGIQELCK